MISRRKLLLAALSAPAAAAAGSVVPAAPLAKLADLNEMTAAGNTFVFLGKKDYQSVCEDMKRVFGKAFTPTDCFTWINSKTGFKAEVFPVSAR